MSSTAKRNTRSKTTTKEKTKSNISISRSSIKKILVNIFMFWKNQFSWKQCLDAQAGVNRARSKQSFINKTQFVKGQDADLLSTELIIDQPGKN